MKKKIMSCLIRIDCYQSLQKLYRLIAISLYDKRSKKILQSMQSYFPFNYTSGRTQPSKSELSLLNPANRIKLKFKA